MEIAVPVGTVAGRMLRGKIDGRKHFGLLCSALSAVAPGGIVGLDFSEVEDISASWIAAAIMPLLPWSALREHDVYPLICNIGDESRRWRDEFELVADRSGATFLIRDKIDFSMRVRLVGTLDPILRETLQAVALHGEVTGAGLKRLYSDEPVGATAWSNRLKDLHTKRLVRRVTRGREQVYSPVLEVFLDGPSNSGIADRDLPKADATRGTRDQLPHSL